ncbi:GyrI-like domain-containing protein [Allosphingosinicella deserti]|uniref:GyrI-like small molecule binding domain-containing protein n=1 Tax=Allosphingosinicella deserti TaxID=2116704 RepID=A0A2P7QV99_9SPHN|nr:GyrI-like domain-containing protein [Sphingomonas deserti]PSJ41907.1 hypothetical protein C7I55_06480 [Sphingomonas deserti]
MDKLDLKKIRKALFTAPLNRFVPVDVPPVRYLMADGHGDPNAAPEYRHAVESLYASAYTLKFMAKAAGRDFVVAPLEGLWSAPDPESFTARRKHEWDWTMMIMVPDEVTEEEFTAARAKAAQKLGKVSPSLRLEILDEGLSLQALHVGSYDDEGPLLKILHDEVMPQGGYRFAGPHHEIYLGDPRKTEAARLRTILRQPVSRC